jgi:hypothetical protein
MTQQLSEPFDRAASHPAALEHRRYALTPLQAIAVVTRRQMTLVLRDKLLLRGRLLQVRRSTAMEPARQLQIYKCSSQR